MPIAGSSGDLDAGNVWSGVVGQPDAVSRLTVAAESPVHAYLLLGSPGCGTFEAALGFAGLVLGAGREASDRSRALRLALAGTHPDVTIIEPEGSALRVEEATEIIRAAQTSPVESSHKVLIVRGVDFIQEAAVGKLLKVIEEPPSSTVFVLLAEDVPPEIVTIASRCVTIEFAPIAIPVLEATLVAEGINPGRAKQAAAASGGDLGRARLLARDEALAARAELWRGVPERLDGRGFAVWDLVGQLREAMDAAQVPLDEEHAVELQALEELVEARGERGSGRATLVARHKREVRRHRNDELRFGLGVLSRAYRDRLVVRADASSEEAVRVIQQTAEQLVRNPNEALLLQGLLLRLSPAP